MPAELDVETLRKVVERARTHDADAWEALYRHSYQRLLGYARRRLPTHDIAEEAVSEAMSRAVRQISTFTWQGSGWDGWMYTILGNVVREWQRQPRRTQDLVERVGSDPTQRRPPWSDPEDHVEKMSEAARLRAAFDLLDGADREILELRVVGELSAAEVGTLVGKSAGAVRMAQSRALERLRQAMKEVAGD